MLVDRYVTCIRSGNVNLLGRFLRGEPDLVDQLVDEEMVFFGQLVDTISSFDPLPFKFDSDLLEEAIGEDQIVGAALREGYLRSIQVDQWRERVAAAQAVESFPPEWVTFVAGRDSGLGLSLPDDDLHSERVSVFTHISGNIRRASIEYHLGAPSGLSVSPPQQCSLPDWGKCPPGECGGHPCRFGGKTNNGDQVACFCP